MRKVVEGKYDISDKIQGMDEIGELHVDLLKMVRSFEQLIHKGLRGKAAEGAAQEQAEGDTVQNAGKPDKSSLFV